MTISNCWQCLFTQQSCQLPTKNELLKMIKEAGGIDGDLTVLGIKNIKRAKRLMGLDLVKTNNARSKND
jgi:hypothetical protein